MKEITIKLDDKQYTSIMTAATKRRTHTKENGKSPDKDPGKISRKNS